MRNWCLFFVYIGKPGFEFLDLKPRKQIYSYIGYPLNMLSTEVYIMCKGQNH